MRVITVLVGLDPESEDAAAFREAVARIPDAQKRVALQFADGDGINTAISEAEVFVCGSFSEEALKNAARLKWVSFWSAGLDNKLTPALLERSPIITNASGVHGANIAEHVLMFMLMFTRRMNLLFRDQIETKWGHHFASRSEGAGELTGQTLGIVGLGRIGEALAKRAKSFEMRVIAVKRDPSSRYSGEIELDAVYGAEELPRLLAESDHVCLSVPYSPQTHHLINGENLPQMKPSAFLYNIGRGKSVDEAALIEALKAGTIAGAGLDVFETEPLPSDSPLWTMENVLITPHNSGMTPHYFTRTASLFAENLERYLNGEPLNNRYRASRGY